MITPSNRSQANPFELHQSDRKVGIGAEGVAKSISAPHVQRSFSAAAAVPAAAVPSAAVIEQSVSAMLQMLSETAHDLRSPLTTVRESVRLIHDGDVGAINEEQRMFLKAALDQCDCIDQMVGEMLHLDRLRSGLPRLNRRWVLVSSIRDAVQETMVPWTMPRNIEVLWDGADDPNRMVFADPAILRRLLVNLIVNAIRVTRENDAVLVRILRAKRTESVVWSVVDQGAGISQAQMKQIEAGQFASTSGEGLGLAISRQLAALHFSCLRLRSRLGYGTEASFQTPTNGPKSVAQCWVRWRQRARAHQLDLSNLDLDTATDSYRESRIQRRIRLDPPLLSVELFQEGNLPRFADRVALGTVSIGAAMSRQDADQFDKLLQNQLRLSEMAYRTDTRRWAWALDADEATLAERMQKISDAASCTIQSLRLNWGGASVIAIDHPAAAAKLSDLLIRNTLAASSPATITSADQVRLGTAPIEASDTATERLDRELRRLSIHLNRQSESLQKQAVALRPQGFGAPKA